MLTKLKLALAIAAPLVAGASTYALAQSQPAADAAEHAAPGAHHAARKAEALARFDANKDGKLDDAERALMRDTRAAERFAKLDTDGDGKLSLAEYKAGAQARHHGRHGHHKLRGAGMKP